MIRIGKSICHIRVKLLLTLLLLIVLYSSTKPFIVKLLYGWRRGGLVVERRTPEREVGGSIITQVAVLCRRARYIYW